MTTPDSGTPASDLGERVAVEDLYLKARIAKLEKSIHWLDSKGVTSTPEQSELEWLQFRHALLRDLHAAATREAEGFEAWAVFSPDGSPHSVRTSEQDAKWAAAFYAEYSPPYTVRRVRCFVEEG